MPQGVNSCKCMTSLREIQLTDKDMEDYKTWCEKLLDITEHRVRCCLKLWIVPQGMAGCQQVVDRELWEK